MQTGERIRQKLIEEAQQDPSAISVAKQRLDELPAEFGNSIEEQRGNGRFL